MVMSDSQRMNEIAHSSTFLRELTPQESVLMRQCLLEIYLAVATLCDREGLTYMMSGGTCLGAVRHHGFIPWDDDLDIMMPRFDYEKLICLCKEGCLGDRFEFSCPNRFTDANTVYLKIFKKGTLCIELAHCSTPFPKGIFIDVFPIDVVPRGKIARFFKGGMANALQLISICTLYAQYPSRPLKEYMKKDSALYTRYKVKLLLGRFFSIVSHRHWIYWFDRFVSSSAEGPYWGIPTGRKYYGGEVFPQEVFIPECEERFEGLTVHIPHHVDIYLRNLYGDYMQLPPVEKRERHFIYAFDVSEDMVRPEYQVGTIAHSE